MNTNTNSSETLLAEADSDKGLRQLSGKSWACLEAILESISDGLIVADPEGNVLLMNSAALSVHGFKNIEEARVHRGSYDDGFERFDAESRLIPDHRRPLARVLAGERFSEMEVRIRRKDTGRVWFGNYSGTPVRDSSGNLVLAVLTLREFMGQKLAEESLRRAYGEMEERVRKRTADLSEANAQLQAEILERQRAEAEVREREGELREAQRVAGIGSWTWVPATDAVTCSEEMFNIFGYDPTLPLPNRADRLKDFTPESRSLLNAAAAQTLEAGVPCELDLEFKTPDKIRKWVRACWAPELDGGGKVAKLRGAVLDITARKLAEEELRTAHAELEKRVARRTAQLSESHTKLAAILESITDGFVTLDREWRYTRVNSAALNFLQMREEDLLGKIIWDVFPALDSIGFGAALRRAMDERVTTQAEAFYPEPLNRWYECRAYPSADGLSVFFTDVTERRRAGEELLKRDLELRTITDHAPEIIGRFDRGVRHLFINRAITRVTGKSAEDYLGRTNEELGHPPELCALWSKAVRGVFGSGKPREVEFSFPSPSGLMHFHMRAVPEFASDGTVESVMFVTTDITSRKCMEESLRKAHNELERRVRQRTAELRKSNERLKAEIAERSRLEAEILQIAEREQRRLGQDLHDDIGQQLSGIGMLAGILAADLGTESHPKAAEAADLAGMLKQAIITARRLAKGFYPIELERGGLIMALTDLAQRMQLVSQVRCEVRHDAQFRFAEAQSIHLYRIVQEALNNAVKHGRPRAIIIKCSGKKGVPVLTVTDDGAGFKKRKHREPGMGLHLFQYRARLIGATLTVKAGRSGGCVVECSLPA